MPAYNEEPGLRDAALRTLDAFRSLELDHELILVDDKSSDRTPEIIAELAAGDARITPLYHERNLGIGGAFRSGLSKASKEYVILVPVDNPLSPEDLAAYLPRVPVSDIVVGVRVERVGYTALARVASFVYNRLFVPLLFNIGVSDVNWIQVYRRNIFDKNCIRIDYPGIIFLVEILAKAKRRRLVITEVPSRMQMRFYGKATCFKISTMWRTFRDMVKFAASYHGIIK